ncbi:hypothetical protein ACOME3_009440 [Neoechinorhynchus agilis]
MVKRHFHLSKTCKLSTMIFLTLLFFCVEIVSGFLTRSVALVADSAHMLSDSCALVIAIVSLRISKRKTDRNTFGWVRAEVLGALVNTVFLMALCTSIIIQALKRFYHFEEIEDNKYLIIVGVIGLLVNLLGLVVLKGDDGHCHQQRIVHSAEMKLSTINMDEQLVRLNIEHDEEPFPPYTKCEHDKIHEGSQLNMKGVSMHVINDALGSVVVIISGLCIRYLPDNWAWKHYLDPTMSLIMVLLIAGFTIPLLIESAMILLQTAPKHIEVKQIRKTLLEQVEGIISVPQLHVWRLSGNDVIASVHIKLRDLYHCFHLL